MGSGLSCDYETGKKLVRVFTALAQISDIDNGRATL
jgi:hypothetical protein